MGFTEFAALLFLCPGLLITGFIATMIVFAVMTAAIVVVIWLLVRIFGR